MAARKLLLHLRLGVVSPPPLLPVPLISRLAPHLHPPAPAPAPPGVSSPAPSCQDPNLRDLFFSFHPAVQIYPSLIDPGAAGEDGEGDGDGAEVWADSVKKKRKRKMNKHKLRKLRKRLRRQT